MASDARLADCCLRIVSPTPALLIFVLHSLFESAGEIARDLMDPQQAVTTDIFRGLVENLWRHGYHFVSPDDIAAGLSPDRRYAMLTFDDGYANNLRALPVLEEFQAPAVFFIASNYVLSGKPFWWDVLYRELHKRGQSSSRLEHARATLKRLPTCEAETRVIAEFGSRAFHTVSDTDRPFTVAELAAFARHPLVHIGNHTADHAVLTNYPPVEMRKQIRQAQESLQTITGKVPLILAYPNGNVSSAVLRAASGAGLRLGATVRSGKNTIPSTSSKSRALLLRRYTLWGNRDLAAQCRIAQSPLSLQTTWATIRSQAIFTR